MFLINTAPAQAAREKGFARYPDDYPHLAPGEEFAAWQSGNDWEIETTLNGHALACHLERLTENSKKCMCVRLVRYRCRNGQVEFLWSGGIIGGSKTAC